MVSPSSTAAMHADDDRLLADIEMAEAADQPHAVHLARLLLEAADQQHVAVEFQELFGRDFGLGFLVLAHGFELACGSRHGGLGPPSACGAARPRRFQLTHDSRPLTRQQPC